MARKKKRSKKRTVFKVYKGRTYHTDEVHLLGRRLMREERERKETPYRYHLKQIRDATGRFRKRHKRKRGRFF